MPEDGVSYAFIDEKTCVIRLSGAIKYMNVATEFEAFIDSLIEKIEINSVIIDMRYCTYIDSTDLGILARISVTQSQRQAPQPVIVYTPKSDIEIILKDVGFNRVFNFVDSIELEGTDFTTLENSGMGSELKMAKLMVDAHKELIGIDDSNIEKFGAVVNLMEKSVEKLTEKDQKKSDD